MTALTLGAYLRQVQSLVHDFTESAWSRREMIERINDARKDVSLDMQVVRKLVTGVQLMRGREVYNFDGAVCGVHITNRGQNYSSEFATVTFSPPASGGVQAEAFARVREPGPTPPPDPDEDEHHWHDRVRPGQIDEIIMTEWGQWYSEVPTITITDPAGTGTGATATPITMLNAINVLSLSNLWNTMRYSLSYRPFTIFQAWARSLERQGFQSYPGMFTIRPGENLVYVEPVPNQTYFSEWDIVKLAEPLVGLHDIDREVKDPYAQAVQYKAAAYLLMKHQNFQQAEYYNTRYDARVPRIIAGAGGIRIANPYNRSAFEKMRRA
jgi:hypothetical protein